MFDVNDNTLLRDVVTTEDLLVVDIHDLFIIECINWYAAQEFQHKYFNQENVIFLTINETIDIMHRRLGNIGRNHVRYMINE